MKVRLAFYLIALFMLAGCSSNSKSVNNPDARTAQIYLESRGYQIVSYEGVVYEYTLNKENVTRLPYSAYWQLPGNDPEPVFGKSVTVHKFIVKNHPLDHYHSGEYKAKGKTEAYVHIAEGKVAAGTSFPVMDQGLDGGYWNIDGVPLK
ncbi:hypothetical protein GE107_21435 [Cohnella sp. CFH 77786]|uniref:hypothetical protein n=1 Tax=Cohnella sp. CFH 77786 TaxID=2662265 RepID=UPI001C6102D9|nr:hypothetical protein [Cohnella sp. CFH 77786]MBW5448613.1 hypothetical protein [Cohnella sp. CFH 77786]